MCTEELHGQKSKLSLISKDTKTDMEFYKRVKDNHISYILMMVVTAKYLCTVFRPCKYARPERICVV